MRRSSINTKRLRDRRRIKARELLGGRCNRCGSEEQLQFDHINPKTKQFNVAMNLGKGWDSVVRELAKCQLLCQQCHIAKTLEDRGLKPSSHGQLSMYKNHRCRCTLCRKANADYTARYEYRS